MKEVRADWQEVIHYELMFRCPHCNALFTEKTLDLYDREGQYIDEDIECQTCKNKFNLRVSEYIGDY